MSKIINWIIKKLTKKRVFHTCDIAENGQDYSVFCLWEIDKDGIIKLKKIKHSRT